MNQHDSEHIAGVLSAAGYTPADDMLDADVIVFNTCCVRQSAEDRVWGNLGALASQGSQGTVVAVTGCMAQLHKEGVLARASAVDLVFGTEAVGRLASLVERAADTRICDVGDVADAEIDGLPHLRKEGPQAWVPVSHGCDNCCSYCVVPGVRGPNRSRAQADILADIETLAAEGVVEVVLLGQNVNSYGRDVASDFASLLEKAAGVGGIRRVKFETSHPRDMSDDVLDMMARQPELCEYLHLPVQSGSDRVLAAMNRGYTCAEYVALAERARKRVPGLVLTTDIIVGFPGETEEDFEATLDLVRRVEFDSAYMFIYSPRDGTAAVAMGGEPGDAVKHERFDRLAGVQEGITESSLRKVVGRDVEVIVTGESKRGDLLVTRTRGNRVVLVQRTVEAEPILRVRIDGSGRHSLRGSVAGS